MRLKNCNLLVRRDTNDINKITVKKIFLVCLFVAFCAQYATAQTNKNWDLARCISHALEHNLSLKQTELNALSGEIAAKRAKDQRLPSLNGQGNQSFNFGFGVNPATNAIQASQTSSSTSIGLGTNVVLFNGLQNYYNVVQQGQNLEAQKSDINAAKNNLCLNIANLYLSIVFGKEQLQNAKNQTEVTQLQVTRMQKLVNSGALSRDNLLNLEAQLANQKFNIVTAQNQWQTNLLGLEQLLQLPHSEGFDVVYTLPEEPITAIPNNVQTLYEQAQSTVPELKSANIRFEVAKTGIHLAKSGLYPRLNLNANVNTFYSNQIKDYSKAVISPDGTTTPIGYLPSSNELVLKPNFTLTNLNTLGAGTQLGNNLGQSVGLTLTLPIFNGFSVKNNISQAKLNVAQAELNKSQTEQQLYQTIATAYQNYTAANEQLKAATQNLLAQKANADFAKIRFEQGLSNSIDFLNIQNAFNNAQSSVLQAKYNLIFRTKILEFYAGKPLY